ncbi:Crp/Fnr family transcriptional regulator [Gammaproteobacteria bacterium AB-CW1]|uniref:Crp/Fnr family transcriptional regulator n=1 Tax=Natronospira elongata TaxID=3110268 RepID=A0AAP6JHY1_9GAMM|nr:Crp/Fnr family transcriptional regulator [Gammaproteobacteria bacterium AB-CW1]
MTARVASNRLLALLPESERAEILSQCDELTLKFGETLVESGATYSHVYFPLRGFISLITIMNEKPALESGLVGAEGMLGATLALGVGSAPTRALVQGAGTTLRMDVAVFTTLIERYPRLRRIVMHYLHVMIEQLAQTSACTRFHLVEARLARWLLMTRDRARSDNFDITQQFLACMLGVRRVGVTAAARKMQERGLIDYCRGHIEILDRRGLEAAACSCYKADRAVYRRIMA